MQQIGQTAAQNPLFSAKRLKRQIEFFRLAFSVFLSVPEIYRERVFTVMIERVGPSTYEAYDQFIANHRRGHFMQTRAWGRHKSSWRWEAILARDEAGEIKGSLAVMIRKVPGMPYSMMYGCRGPVCDETDLETAKELFEGAKKLAKELRCYILKLDPDIRSDRADFAALMAELGFTLPPDTKNFESIQPRYVFRLDVEGRTEENLLNSFESKTRYNIRLAMRKGVEVKICGDEAVDDFSRIMNETGERDHFIVRNADYFRSILRELGDDARIYMAYHEGTPIAGTLAIHFAGKVWYLYGASSNQSRNLMPNYLLQWEMIRWAVETGCFLYDFRGVSGDLSPENPLYGLYRFKKGFMGDFTEFLGEYDYVLKPWVVSAVKGGRNLLSLVRRAKRRLRGGKKNKESAE